MPKEPPLRTLPMEPTEHLPCAASSGKGGPSDSHVFTAAPMGGRCGDDPLICVTSHLLQVGGWMGGLWRPWTSISGGPEAGAMLNTDRLLYQTSAHLTSTL